MCVCICVHASGKCSFMQVSMDCRGVRNLPVSITIKVCIRVCVCAKHACTVHSHYQFLYWLRDKHYSSSDHAGSSISLVWNTTRDTLIPGHIFQIPSLTSSIRGAVYYLTVGRCQYFTSLACGCADLEPPVSLPYSSPVINSPKPANTSSSIQASRHLRF